ncbi:MAG: RluA family pseudouridine synthase [Lachnospiraceae bacterium]|nr:RluA family pseudouridine synthase [Lachnospiraceae bacterium]
MDKVLNYIFREEDLEDTAGGLINLVLRNRVGVTGHEISSAKFHADGITVNGHRVTVKYRMKPGDVLRVVLPEDRKEQDDIAATEGPLEILYEDEDLAIVNKPALTPVHPSYGHYSDSLGNYMAYYRRNRGLDGICRVIGRLDIDTSGAVIFAFNKAAAGRLVRQRDKGELVRTYHALVHSIFAEDKMNGVLQSRMDRVEGEKLLRQIRTDGSGLEAVTRYSVIAQNDISDAALVQFRIDTGRTHQIRVHMADAAHPLYGDPLYGKAEDDGFFNSLGYRKHSLLHAAALTLLQPFTGERIEIKVPYPDDFREAATVLKLLRQ